MKAITYTTHAPTRIEERELKLSWIEQVARRPEWRELDPKDPTVERRLGPIEDFGGRVLRVVVRETEGQICVIIANFDRGARRRRARQQL